MPVVLAQQASNITYNGDNATKCKLVLLLKLKTEMFATAPVCLHHIQYSVTKVFANSH